MTNSKHRSKQSTSEELIKTLSDYFSQRGSFLAQVIRADLQAQPLLTNLNGAVTKENIGDLYHQQSHHGIAIYQGNGRNKAYHNGTPTNTSNGSSNILAYQNGAAINKGNGQAHDSGSATNQVIQISQESNPLLQKPLVKPLVPSQQNLDVEAILIELVVKQTGYPPESINLNLQLLDDLNLDSIKGGELIAAVAKECGVAGQVDPTTLANATLKEIVEAVRAAMPATEQVQEASPGATQSVVVNSASAAETSIPQLLIEIVAQRTGFPPESLSMDLRLLDDLNLDSIKTAELVAEVAKEVGVEAQVDPSNFANASLTEVAQTLQQLIQEQKVQPQQPSVSAQQPTPASELTASSSPWVRNFVVEYVAEEAPIIAESSQEENWETANLFAVDNWKTAKPLIIAEPEEAEIVAALSQELQERGAQVETATFIEIGDRALINQVPFTHFIAVLPRTAKGEMSSEARLQRAMERVRAVATPPAAAQAQRAYTTVAYLQFGGGYFGRLPQMSDIEQSCTLGFAASLHLERSDLKVRVLDLCPSLAPESLGTKIVDELSRPEAFVAAGYDADFTRRVPRPRVQDRSRYQNRQFTWSSQDVLLVTGGAKGITSECALAFARITGVRMALVGSSPHPQDNPTGKGGAEIASTLRRFSEEGLTCRYYQCNITDAAVVATLIQRVEQDLGQITGVIHGAALNKPRRVENATLAEARAEVAPKVLGVMNLCQALQNKPPKLFVGFSSISAVLGLPGNTWYGFSNEALDLILRRFGEEHPETSVLAIAFSVWAEVGMGARMGTVKNLARMGIEAMPTDDGVRLFLQLMTQEPGDSQIIVSARLGGIDTLRRGFDTWRTKRVPPTANLKFIEQVQIMEPNVEIVARTHLSLEKDSYVQDHIYKGSHLFPTVFGLEAMAQAVAYATGQSQFQTLHIEDVRLERPIVVDPEKGVDIEIRAEVLERELEQEPLQVRAQIRTEQTGFAVAHFAATFVLESKNDSPIEPIELPAVSLDIQPQQDLYGWLLFQGSRFQRLQQVYSLNSKQFVFRTQRGLLAAEEANDSFDRASGPFLLGDPYYRDSLLQAVQPVVPQDICLPIHIRNLDVYQPNRYRSDSCIGVVILHGREGRQYYSTVLAVDEEGHIIDKLDGYRLQILEHREDNPTAEELAEPSQRDEQLLHQELQWRAAAFQTIAPEISLAYMSGLHGLSAAERHQRELPVFSRTVSKVLKAESENG